MNSQYNIKTSSVDRPIEALLKVVLTLLKNLQAGGFD
jgi:hypothetical protein